MKGRKVFYTEAAYIFGILFLAIGTALMEKASFGVSMVVAPAYIIHLKVSESLSWFTFGVSEFMLQGFLLILLSAVLGRMKLCYLFSFATAVIYGLVLDGAMYAASFINSDVMAMRVLLYVSGIFICAIGIAFFFRSYITPEAYELAVKEIAARLGKDPCIIKTAYDISSCLISVVLSFMFFGFGVFKGVELGTAVCAAVNGYAISIVSKAMDRMFLFEDGLALRRLFER